MKGVTTLLVWVMFFAVSFSVSSNDGVTQLSGINKITFSEKSNKGIYTVSAAANGHELSTNKYHSWTITVKDNQARPVYPLSIAVNGGMPGHAHGLPTQPLLVNHDVNGIYIIDGFKFHMAGEWFVLFKIKSSLGEDIVRLSFEI